MRRYRILHRITILVPKTRSVARDPARDLSAMHMLLNAYVLSVIRSNDRQSKSGNQITCRGWKYAKLEQTRKA